MRSPRQLLPKLLDAGLWPTLQGAHRFSWSYSTRSDASGAGGAGSLRLEQLIGTIWAAHAIVSMNEREEIRKRVEQFRKLQERLAKEREERMNRVTQQTRANLDKLFKPD